MWKHSGWKVVTDHLVIFDISVANSRLGESILQRMYSVIHDKYDMSRLNVRGEMKLYPKPNS